MKEDKLAKPNLSSNFLEKRKDILELIKEKILAAWGSARDQFDVPNIHRMAELFYKSLYQQETLGTEKIFGRPEFNRSKFLESEINLNSDLIPTEEEFIEATRRAMTIETAYDKCVIPGSIQSLKDLSQYGPVTIWTRGDVHGQPEAGYKGSQEQLRKLAISGVAEQRREIAREKGVTNKEAVTIVASENKFEDIPKILESYKNSGCQKVIVFDDMASNLNKFMQIASQVSDLQIVPVWVRQGRQKNSYGKDKGKVLENVMRELNAHDSFQGITEKLIQEQIIDQDQKNGFIVDYDGVISDDDKRVSEQVKAVIEMMIRKGWLK